MNISNARYCLLILAAVILAGCGAAERTEGGRFAQALAGQKANFARANALEQELVNSARAWCGGITANGAGRGVELDQNAVVAAELAKSALAISSHLSEVRQAIDGQTLQETYPRNVRNLLTTRLTSRQRMLQDMRALLEQASPQFLEYQQSKAYVGDTYPDGIGKLDALLRSYRAPEDALGAALTALQEKYNLSNAGL